MRTYKHNWGKFLFVRFLIVSWTLQAIHVLDKSERLFRLTFEASLFAILLIMWLFDFYSLGFLVILTFVLHTLFWLFDSTWLVEWRQVNPKFKGKGIESVIEFVDWAVEELKGCENVTSITIYGSICRHKYHDRSDFDFRIVQNGGRLITYFKMIKLRTVAIWKYRIPIDLKLVDSVDFLKREMREDEHPIVPFNKYASFYNEGDSYQDLKKHPEKYLKSINIL